MWREDLKNEFGIHFKDCPEELKFLEQFIEELLEDKLRPMCDARRLNSLKPCPFCGHAPAWRKSKKRRCQLHGDIIQDDILGCFSPFCKFKPQISETIKEHSMREWNKRV